MDQLSPSDTRNAAEGRDPPPPSADELKNAILAKLVYSIGKDVVAASQRDWFLAVAFATRDIVVDRWMNSTRETYDQDRKRVYYLSLEFLIGRMLFDAMTNLGIVEPMQAALAKLGVDLAVLRRLEPDAALGNGGLGRLAACFMDSMATLSIAAHGYGIRYDNGLFRQVIRDGWQQEAPEDWLAFGNPWEFARPESNYAIGFGGHVEAVAGAGDKMRHVWKPAETVEAVGYDTPIVGWRGRHVNTLRLWSARAPDPLRLDAFNAGDYIGALADRVRAEAISKVLYPSDATPAGQELRLRQEYFFASASLLDLVRRHVKQHRDIRSLGDKVAIQLNDTHPAIAIAELMRILVDLNGLDWEEAWAIAQGGVLLHQPHAAARGAGKLAGDADGAAAAAPHADHLSHQRDASRRRAQGRLHRARRALLGVVDRRARRPAHAHGQSGLHRVAQDQRRFGAAYRSDAQDGVSRPQRRLSRPHHQQDQRHHLSPLADGGQSRG